MKKLALGAVSIFALGAALAWAQSVGWPPPGGMLMALGTYNSTPPTLTNGQVSPIQLSAAGRLLVDAATTPSSDQNVTETPKAATANATLKTATQAAASNAVVKSSAGNLYGLTVTIGATAGWVMVFDATALPSNGATGATMVWCYPVNSDGTKGGIDKDFFPPIPMATGITIGFSSTACNSLTASATAFFYGRYM